MITTYIDGFLLPLRWFDLQAREKRLRSSFLEIVVQARSRAELFRAQQQLTPPGMKPVVFPNKREGGEILQYADADNESFAGEASHAGAGLMSAGKSSAILEFSAVPWDSSKQNQNALILLAHSVPRNATSTQRGWLTELPAIARYPAPAAAPTLTNSHKFHQLDTRPASQSRLQPNPM